MGLITVQKVQRFRQKILVEGESLIFSGTQYEEEITMWSTLNSLVHVYIWLFLAQL